jgi:hypothetical protein
MSNKEKYPDDWVKLNLMIDPKTGEIHATGGDLNDGPKYSDVGYKGFDILNEMIKSSINTIYTITTLRNLKDIRCIGFYFEFDQAAEEVLNNSCDMCECGNYPYCVIEEIKPGLYYYSRPETWFEWDYIKQKYHKIDEKPEEFKNIGGFGLG